jgi:hypothetical protein
MYLDVYIGWLEEDGSLDKGEDPSIGNAPIRVSPFFPDGSQAFSLLKDKIEAGEFKGEKVDWGAWAAAVTKQQIISFMDEHYGEDRKPWKEGFDNLYKQLRELEEFVEGLPEDKMVALVASEL